MVKNIQKWVKTLWIGLAGLLLAGWAPLGTVAQEKDKDVAAVIADWAARQKLMTSVRYILKGGKETVVPPKQQRSLFEPRRIVLLLDLVNHRFSMEETEEPVRPLHMENGESQEGRGSKKIITTTFDGTRVMTLNQGRNSSTGKLEDAIHISKADRAYGPFGNDTFLPILFAHGLMRTPQERDRGNNWPTNATANDFLSFGLHPLDGQNLLVLRTKPIPFGIPSVVGGGMKPGRKAPPADVQVPGLPTGKDPTPGERFNEAWIRKDRQSAISRYIEYSGSSANNSMEIAWKETPQGWWVDHWSNTITWGNDGTSHITRFQVESMEANQPISEMSFTLPVQPGNRVTLGQEYIETKNYQNKENRTLSYTVSPQGDWILLPPPVVQKPHQERSWLPWIGAALGCTVLVLLTNAYRRRGKMANGRWYQLIRPW